MVSSLWELLRIWVSFARVLFRIQPSKLELLRVFPFGGCDLDESQQEGWSFFGKTLVTPTDNKFVVSRSMRIWSEATGHFLIGETKRKALDSKFIVFNCQFQSMHFRYRLR